MFFAKLYSEDKEAENLLKKLRELSEDDCKKLICDIQRNYHLPWKARTVGEMIAVARQESGVQKLEGRIEPAPGPDTCRPVDRLL